MEIKLGDDTVEKRELLPLSDTQGFLAMGYCSELALKVEYEEAPVDFMTV